MNILFCILYPLSLFHLRFDVGISRILVCGLCCIVMALFPVMGNLCRLNDITGCYNCRLKFFLMSFFCQRGQFISGNRSILFRQNDCYHLLPIDGACQISLELKNQCCTCVKNIFFTLRNSLWIELGSLILRSDILPLSLPAPAMNIYLFPPTGSCWFTFFSAIV